MAAENASTAPMTRTIAPSQSQRVHVDRQRRAGSDSHANQRRLRAKTAKRTASWVRVSVATTEAPSAAAARPQLGATSVLAISQSASVESGYASGSSTKIGEYARAGTATAAPAAANAYHGRTTSRARPYAGKIVAVIARTRRSFAVA